MQRPSLSTYYLLGCEWSQKMASSEQPPSTTKQQHLAVLNQPSQQPQNINQQQTTTNSSHITSNKEPAHSCTLCDIKFDSESSLRVHLQVWQCDTDEGPKGEPSTSSWVLLESLLAKSQCAWPVCPAPLVVLKNDAFYSTTCASPSNGRL